MYAQVYKERDSKGKILAIHVRYSRVTSSRYFRPSLHFTGENGEHELRGEPERQVPKGRFPPDKEDLVPFKKAALSRCAHRLADRRVQFLQGELLVKRGYQPESRSF